MKVGWRVKTLGELCRIELGSTPARNNSRFWDMEKETSNVWLSIADLRPGLHPVCNDSKEYVSDEAARNMRIVPRGTLLVSFKLTLGRLAYAGRDLFTNEAIASLLDIDESILLKEYLYWALTVFDWHAAAEGDHKIKGKTLNKKKLKLIPIPLPPLEEQKQIVAILDETFEGLDRARANVEANLEESRQLLLRHLDIKIAEYIVRFGIIPINKLADVKGGKRLPKGVKLTAEKTPYPYITVRDFTEEGTVSASGLGFITKEIRETILRYTISSRDVYISIAGTIGKTGIVPEHLEGANLTENAAKLVLKDGWRKEYVYWCTRSTDFQAQTRTQTRVAAQPKLALQRLGQITIPRADPKTQEWLSASMSEMRGSVDQLEASFRAKLVDLSDLRQSLLQKAFAGELT
ncbi:MAG: hypothetical protein C1943_12795 [Halochromatium sp.]|nr:hypothetical protein [Halochromatium sp.]